MANTALVAGAGLVFWLLAARLLPPSEIGLATAAASAITLIAMLAKLGADVSLLRLLPKADGPGQASLVDTALTVTGIAAFLGGIAFCVGAPVWSPTLAVYLGNPLAILAFSVLAAVWTHQIVYDSVYSALRRSDFAFLKNALQGALKIGLLFALAASLRSVGVFLAWTASMAIALIIVRPTLPRLIPGYRFKVRMDRAVLRESFRGSLANYAVSFAAVLPLSVGSLIVLEARGASEASLYYIIWNIGSIASMAPLAFARAALVEFSKRGDTRLHWQKPLAISMAAGFGTIAVGAMLLPLLGETYLRAVGLPLLPFALATAPGYFLQVRVAQFRATGQHVPLVLGVSIASAVYLAGLALLPLAVTSVGWLWLGALMAAAAFNTAISVRPLMQDDSTPHIRA